MNHHEIRLELLQLAFEMRREITPTPEDIIETAEQLAEFVFGDDVEFDVDGPEDPFEDPQAES
jgi:hypothetical protein